MLGGNLPAAQQRLPPVQSWLHAHCTPYGARTCCCRCTHLPHVPHACSAAVARHKHYAQSTKKGCRMISDSLAYYCLLRLFFLLKKKISTRSTSAPSSEGGQAALICCCHFPTFPLQHWLQIGSSSLSSTCLSTFLKLPIELL